MPRPAFGDLLAQPHQEHRSGDQRHDADEAEHQAGVEHQALLRLEGNGYADRLEDRQAQRAVARVLRDLAAARLAFLAQRLERGQHVGQHLHDDRRRDVRHDPQCEHREARQRATGEHVEQTEDAALLRIEQLTQLVRIDARHRDMRADPVDDERQQQEEQTPLEVAVLSGAADRRGCAGRHARMSCLRQVRLITAFSMGLFRPLLSAGFSAGLFTAALIAAALSATAFFAAAFFAVSGVTAGSATEPPAASIAAFAPLVTPMPRTVNLARQLAGLDDARVERERRHDPRLLEHRQVDLVDAQSLQVRQAHDFDIPARKRRKATLRQAAIQRHLAALETDLVKAAGARLLALVAAAGGLAPAGTDAAADAMARTLAAGGGFQIVQAHVRPLCLLADPNQVGNLVDHAAHRGRVFQFARLVHLLQARGRARSPDATSWRKSGS